jgi:sterol desaturase/sphingolipid hydroxylase (fatty acid hydroxylase superfamily)
LGARRGPKIAYASDIVSASAFYAFSPHRRHYASGYVIGQTLMRYKLGHHRMGGRFFHNHINFHHTYYSKDHLVSRTYLGDEGNNTPFFFIPVFLAGGCAYFILPLNLFMVMVIASAASFYAHVFFDKEYHVEGSRLQRFAWFRRKQELHFVHHRHANYNFAVIHFFWDRLLGTYRRPDAGA